MKSNFLLTSGIKTPDESDIEIVERKGIGHPDTLADGIAESISNNFSKYCLENYGAILNHWLDKTLLTGALGEMDYGYGALKSPILVYLFGKMSESFGDRNIDINSIVTGATKDFLSNAVPLLDLNKNLEIKFTQNSFSKNPHWMHPRNVEDLPNRNNPRANDTSVGVGYWPLSRTENLALILESYFYESNGNPKFNHIGQDIKVLISRHKNRLSITMCVPFISKFVPDEMFYLTEREKLQNDLTNKAREFMGSDYEIELTVNNADLLGKDDRQKRKGYYFLVTGTALDDGEVGVVGRGNPASGVISCLRPHSMEAPNGKNPVHHVGKVYTYLANKLSRKISQHFDTSVTVFLSSQMGNLLSEPANITIQSSKDLPQDEVQDMVFSELSKGIWAEEIVKSKFFIPSPGNLLRKYAE